MFSIRFSAVAAAAILSACGGGGSASADINAGMATYGALALVSSQPADGDVQVAPTAAIRLTFDNRVVLASLQRTDTTLTVLGDDEAIAGTWTITEGGTVATFAPQASLQPETDYVFTLSPFTCDAEARILEVERTFTFRTLDETPPAIASANVAQGEPNRSRTAPLQMLLNDDIAPSSVTQNTVHLTDSFGSAYPVTRAVAGRSITVTPIADLPGSRQMTLTITRNVTDRAGNAAAADWSVTFTTAADATAPAATSVWPGTNATGLSPRVEPIFTFNESMDPTTVEPSSVLFQDEFGSILGYTVACSEDQRTLRICPLQSLAEGRRYTLAFVVSGAAVTDVSGNALTQTVATSFTTGTDRTEPELQNAQPANLEARVSLNATPRATFTEPLDSAWVTSDTVQLLVDGVPALAVLTMPDSRTVQLEPVLDLAPDTQFTLQLKGGASGLRDQAGNRMAQDVTLTFTTADDATLPTAQLQPADGAIGVPAAMRASLVFGSQLDPLTVSGSTIELRTDAGQSIPAQVSLTSENRVVVVTPLVPLSQNTYYRTFVRGGSSGVREASGNWLSQDLGARFRIGSSQDFSPPSVTLTVNGIDASRRTGLVLPTSGFTVHVDALDGSQSPDMGSVRVDFTGEGSAPSASGLYADATIAFRSFRAQMPVTMALQPGQWTMTARVSDLSGNVGVSAPISFTVLEATGGLVPFERTQVIWARTDLDRDSNGRADFDDDMLRLGLATAGDPLGTNAFIRDAACNAILAHANSLFGRNAAGEPVNADSMGARFTSIGPAGLPHMQIALGGLDPQGSRTRGYGDATTGVLGRAYYDYRNSNIQDRNIGTSPGLGVFPGEMFLYQADLHQQLYPSFVTMFAQRFLALCPNMGGTPAGSSAIDAQVFTASFDPANATSQQLARHNTVWNAIDDWARATGTVLAHETGHAVGLVAPGPAPSGLFGDSSLHNANASAAEVMAAAVGYEAMVSLDYAFRDTDAAYMRHRILVR